VEEIIILAPQTFTEDVEKAVIRLQVMLSALWLISWRGRLAATVTCHGYSKDIATVSTQGVIVYMGPKYEKFYLSTSNFIL
jgi:hypothetical protein